MTAAGFKGAKRLPRRKIRSTPRSFPRVGSQRDQARVMYPPNSWSCMHQQPITPHSDSPFVPLLPNLVGLLGALGDIDDLEGCSERNCQHRFKATFKIHLPSCISFYIPNNSDGGPMRSKRTRGQALLELVGLVGVLQDKGVKVAVAADLELGLLVLAVLLDAGG